MKVSYVSSNAINQALRYSLMRMQSQLVKGQTEATTGKVADTGLALGARTGNSISLHRDVDRLKGIIDTNALVSSRLSASQEALSDIRAAGESFLSAVAVAASGGAEKETAQQAGQLMLDTLTGIINTSFNGEYIFAGVNTDIKPLNDYSAGSDSKADFDAAFQAEFGFAQTDAAAGNLTAAEIQAFLEGPAAAEFTGTQWQDNWSNATDQGITSRITLGETTETSVSANEEGIQKIAMAATVVADLFNSELSEDALRQIAEFATSLVGEALGDIATTQGRVGFVEQRVTQASERLTMQVDLFSETLLEMEGVDPYEAATRVEELRAQIETAYTLTARLNQLSLLRYL
ncbi:flagellar hook-associated family protein [Mesorhizobium xinjiangense]|uniref:flagellar hook-associated family protein n=1 Tax=Mesorhizobium xinjiangense TaxID=2678685 RepID=UPI0012EE8A9A|nr:flagellar hook-associated family protein [Mesorhizobium xinjiangense]